jgi:DNA-binding MarR family transcriptional regulator
MRNKPAREALDPAQLAAYFALMEVSSQLRHAVERQLREAGRLSYVQFQILAALSDGPGEQRMTDLADRLVLGRSALTYQAGQLEQRGLVARSPSLDDERSTTVRLTESGRALLDHVLPGHVEVVRAMLLAELSPDDVRALTSILGRVRDRMRAAPPRSAAPRRRRSNLP